MYPCTQTSKSMYKVQPLMRSSKERRQPSFRGPGRRCPRNPGQRANSAGHMSNSYSNAMTPLVTTIGQRFSWCYRRSKRYDEKWEGKHIYNLLKAFRLPPVPAQMALPSQLTASSPSGYDAIAPYCYNTVICLSVITHRHILAFVLTPLANLEGISDQE